MSHKASNWLSTIPADKIKSGAFRVLFHLCDAHNSTQPMHLACFPNQATLRKKSGMSNGGLNNALNTLEKDGFLRRRRTRTSEGTKGPTYYILGCDDANVHQLTPDSGDGANSSLEAEPSPVLGTNQLQPTGDKPVIDPVKEPVMRTRKARATKNNQIDDWYSQEPIQALTKMFEGWKHQNKSIKPVEAAKEYLGSITGVSDLAIIEAADEFFQGTPEKFNPRFGPPSIADFQRHVRKLDKMGKQIADVFAKDPNKLNEVDVDFRAKCDRWVCVYSATPPSQGNAA